MKKIVCLLLVCVLVMGFVGCSNNLGQGIGEVLDSEIDGISETKEPDSMSDSEEPDEMYPIVTDYAEGECNAVTFDELEISFEESNNSIVMEERYEDYVRITCSDCDLVTGTPDYYEIQLCPLAEISDMKDVLNLPELSEDYSQFRSYEAEDSLTCTHLYSVSRNVSEYESETLFVFDYNGTYYCIKSNNSFFLPDYLGIDDQLVCEKQAGDLMDLKNEGEYWCESLTMYPQLNQIECVLPQNPIGDGYSVYSLTDDENQETVLTVYNEAGVAIQCIDVEYCPDFLGRIPDTMDYNNDGYLDMRLNGSYYAQSYSQTIYVFNPETQSFEMVTYDGVLADFELREDKIWNWVRSGEGYVIEILKWDGLTHLVKESEEYTEPDD